MPPRRSTAPAFPLPGVALGAGLAAVALLAGCSRPAPQRDLLLVTIDTLRADHVSASGHSRAPGTPAFDRLAFQGLFFEQAVAPTPLTLPSHASILTGQWPFRHGVRDNGGFRLPTSVPTLAEALRARGYRTAAFVGSFVLDSRFGLDRGFELYDDAMPDGREEIVGYLGEARRDGNAVAAAASAWIDAAEPRPIFVWVHLYDPHAPYEAAPGLLRQYPGRPYAAAVAQADAALGKLLEAFDRRSSRENTAAGRTNAPAVAAANIASPPAVIAVVGDHGEGLEEHGEGTHGVFVYDSTLRVPLALSAPGLPHGVRVSWQVRLVDLAPTLLNLSAGGAAAVRSSDRPLDAVLAPDGIDLSPFLIGRTPPPVLPAYAESLFGTYHYGWSPLRALREAGKKWIEAPRPELYALTSDTGETRNLLDPGSADSTAEGSAEARSMAGRLAALAGPADSPAPSPAAEDPETLARLRSLGYAGGGGPGTGAGPPAGATTDARAPAGIAAAPLGALTDPKDGILRHTRFEAGFREAATRFDAGDYAAALRAAAALLRDFPEARDALRLRGLAALNLRRDAEARRDMESLLARDPHDAEARSALGRILERSGERKSALEQYLAALSSGPGSPTLHLHAARLLRQEGRLDEAEEMLRRVLQIDPNLRGVHHNLALLLEERGDLEAARLEYEAEIAAHPEAAASHLNLGLILDRKGEHTEARRHLEAATVAAPRDPRALTALAAMLLRDSSGTQRARAQSLLERALGADPKYAPAVELARRAGLAAPVR